MTNHRKKISSEEWIRMYEALTLPRAIEERMLKLLRQNKLGKWFSGIGQEAISVGVGLAAGSRDYLLPMHRNLGLFTSRNVPLYPLFCQLFGKADGFTGGRDRSFHFGLTDERIVGMISHLAATMPVAAGLALASTLKGEECVAVSFCGDGGTSEGDFHETLNLASVWNLPVIFMIENNGYGLSTPVSEQYACEKLSDRAIGYGMEGMHIDGNDLIKVMDAVTDAREIALSGKPVLIEALTFRMRGHEESSGISYVPESLLEEWRSKDPIIRLGRELMRLGVVRDEQDLDEIRQRVEHSFEEDLRRALEADPPRFDRLREERDASVLIRQNTPQPSAAVRPVRRSGKRFIDAIRSALLQAMDEDPRILIMGQDVAGYGGIFKVTDGLLERFGRERIRNTPITESAVIGAAVGLALEGFKPVVEMQFADFISCGFNQIVNQLSKGRYRWMPPLNVTIRAPHGAGVGAGPFHSQSPEGWFMHHPGIRIVVPATVQDAQDMLYSSLFDPNPVLFFEHKKLYRSLEEEVPDSCRRVSLDRAKVIRTGSDASIITYGMGVHWAMSAAERFAGKGVSLEIVDLRSLAPVDMECVRKTVRNTSRVLLLQEPSQTLGPMSELASLIVESCFEMLDAPVVRCSSLDIPIPFHPDLEKGVLAESRLDEKLEKLLNF